MDITNIISNLGFPIACAACCGYFINNMVRTNREDNINRENKLMEQLGQVNATNRIIVETNAEIANKLDIKIDAIDKKLDKVLEVK